MAKNYIGGVIFSAMLHGTAIAVFLVIAANMDAKPPEKIVIDLSAVVIERAPAVPAAPVVAAVEPAPEKKRPSAPPKPKKRPAVKKQTPKQAPVKQEPEKVKLAEATETSVAAPEPEVVAESVTETAEHIDIAEETLSAPAAAVNVSELRAGYVDSNFSYIHRRIKKNIVYPPQAKRTGLRGKVFVKFTINGDGTASDITVATSSGYKILDEAGLNAVRVSVPFPEPPVPANIVVPIDFRLM